MALGSLLVVEVFRIIKVFRSLKVLRYIEILRYIEVPKSGIPQKSPAASTIAKWIVIGVTFGRAKVR